MLRLKLLGTISLERDGVAIAWLNRGWQRGALFALLATSGKRGMDREILASLLWPDSDQGASRHSLDELLSRSRRETDCKTLFSVGNAIAFNTDDITCDLFDFNACVHNQQYERATELYQGPLADGLRISASAEAERRIESLRAEIAVAFMSALLQLARRKGEQGDHQRAAAYWQRAVQTDPLSVSANKGFLNALIAAGESPRAAAHLRVFRSLLQQEFGIEPDDELRALEHRLRLGTQALSASVQQTARVESQNSVIPGEQLHRSVLVRVLGTEYLQGALIEESALANVFQIKNRATGADLELHLIRSPIASPSRQKQFEHAFAAVSRLSHPNVVPVFTYGVIDSIGYLIAGTRQRETLRTLLKRGRTLPLSDSISLLRTIGLALREAHQAGVYHGDLRPKRIGIQNALAYVTGFGMVSALSGGENPGGDSQSTAMALGSPLYQSPEQMYERAGADAASDIYAFGCIAYEFLAGEPPFGEPGLAMARRKLAGQVTALRELRPTITPAQESAVMTCLAYAPGDRGIEFPLLTES